MSQNPLNGSQARHSQESSYLHA